MYVWTTSLQWTIEPPFTSSPPPRLAGCYEALAGGQTGDALVDFTGGVNEVVDIREGGYQTDVVKQEELFEKMYHAHEHKALTSCSIAVSLCVRA